MDRRRFLALGAGTIGTLYMHKTLSATESMTMEEKEPFKISLAQWSWNKRLFGRAEPKMDNLDFAENASKMGIKAIEYVNQFFKDKGKDMDYLAEMKKRAADNGVKSLLIMCDGEGNLGDPDAEKRTQTIENHYKWVDAAKFLGCHSIRVNAYSAGSPDEQKKLVSDGLRCLGEFAAKQQINVIVENHGGLSSNPEWLVSVMKEVDLPNCGTLPDFGNFPPEIDRYEAVKAMMPFAKAVSAKSYEFNDIGDESRVDFYKMMKIVLEAGYKGYVGIEYEGSKLSEDDGIAATQKLLEKIRSQYKKA